MREAIQKSSATHRRMASLRHWKNSGKVYLPQPQKLRTGWPSCKKIKANPIHPTAKTQLSQAKVSKTKKTGGNPPYKLVLILAQKWRIKLGQRLNKLILNHQSRNYRSYTLDSRKWSRNTSKSSYRNRPSDWNFKRREKNKRKLLKWSRRFCILRNTIQWP